VAPLTFIKAHALGNDFLLLDEATVPAGADRPALARRACDRHRGIGGDGLIFFRNPGAAGAETSDARVTMALLNADGSYSEVSGNGVRCLAAWIAEETRTPVGGRIQVDTDAGPKRLELLSRDAAGLTFRAAMGQPENVAPATIDVDGERVEAVTLRVGNPQCVVLGEVSEARLHRIAARLAVHPAVAAMVHGGAARDVEVIAPGGAQRVEWRDDGLYLTGPAEIIGSIRMHA
jgi:diaminopimelate epimerase